MVSLMITREGNISLVLKGKQYFVNRDAKNYDAVFNAIKEGKSEDEFLDIVDNVSAIQKFFVGTEISISDGVVCYKGEEVKNSVVDRILSFIKDELPVTPLVNFLNKLMQNPSFSARKELFDFLDHKFLPICEDGDFLAYKAVKNDFTDKHNGTTDASIGNVVSIAREQVDDDRNNGCSFGLHAGTLAYVREYGNFNGANTDACIIVKINPKNVVSVPSDCNYQKLRTCEYVSLREYEGELLSNLYKDNGDTFEKPIVEDEDFIVEDEDFFDEDDIYIEDETRY